MPSSQICKELHCIFNKAERLRFPFNPRKIPPNGIYILFEKGENAHGTTRIVRIGTHTGEGQLHSRLKEHFINKNKDRSIFRKNIGRCFLNKSKDPYLKTWDMDFTTSEAREKEGHLRDILKEQEVEERISKYIQENFSFCCFGVDSKDHRLYFEKKIIGTVSKCEECACSNGWLGRYSPKRKIRESGLWLVQWLYGESLSDQDIILLRSLIG